MDIIYWSVRLSSRRWGDGVFGVDRWSLYSPSYKFHFIRVYNHLSNNKSIKQSYNPIIVCLYLILFVLLFTNHVYFLYLWLSNLFSILKKIMDNPRTNLNMSQQQQLPLNLIQLQISVKVGYPQFWTSYQAAAKPKILSRNVNLFV